MSGRLMSIMAVSPVRVIMHTSSAKVHLFLHGVAEREYNLPVTVFHNHRRKSRRNKEREVG